MMPCFAKRQVLKHLLSRPVCRLWVTGIIVLLLATLPLTAFAAPPASLALEAFVQTGHSGNINATAFSPDGRYALSGADDHTLRLWDIVSGKEIRTFHGHSAEVTSVAFSPDGRRVVSGSNDMTVRVWDAAGGTCLHILSGHTFYVRTVAVSPDGRYILSGSGYRYMSVNRPDTDARLWDLTTGKEVRVFTGHRGHINSVSFTPDGRYALTASSDKTLRLWEVASGQQIKVFKGHKNIVKSVAVSPDGRYALSGSGDQTLHLWDIESGRDLVVFKGHTDSINAAVFSPDGKHVLSGSRDKTVRLWDAVTGRELHIFTGHEKDVNSVSFNPDGRHALSGSDDGTIRFWDISTGKEAKQFTGQQYAINSLAISRDGRYILSGNSDTSVCLWDLEAGFRKQIFVKNSRKGVYINAVALSPDSRHAYSANWYDKKIEMWDTATGKNIKASEYYFHGIESLAVSPTGRYVLAGSMDIIRLWDVGTGREAGVFRGHEGAVTSVAISPDGRYAASGGFSDRTVRLWDMQTHRQIRKFGGFFSGHKKPVESVVFSPDGRYVASGSRDNTVRLWEVATGDEMKVFNGHTNEVKAVAFSPDSRYIASGGKDDKVRLWDIAGGREVKVLSGHTNHVRTVAFLPDGQRLVSGGQDGSLRIWNVETGEELAVLYHLLEKDWVIMTKEGYFNASADGARHINVRAGTVVYNMGNSARRFFRPEMVQLALGGKALPQGETAREIAQMPAPAVRIISPQSDHISSQDMIAVRILLSDAGGGIGDVFLYVNDALVGTDVRALKISAGKGSREMQFNVALAQGKNTIRAVAYNADNSISSTPESVTVTCDFKAGLPILHVLAVGIDRYENSELNLRYAAADAVLFAEALKQKSAVFFREVRTTIMTRPGDTTRVAINTAFEKVSGRVKAGDYFVFYASSHGHIATFSNGDSKYFLITGNTVFLDPDNLKKDALSQDDLIRLIGSIPAQNKLVVLDSCHSGEAGRTIQIAMAGTQKVFTRGLSTATAMQLLKMASGSSVFTASQSVEEAIEGYKGHGLFTYTLVEGLKGAADENGDGYITLGELKGYVERAVFARSGEHFKRRQVPYINVGTLDTPLAGVK